MGFIEAQGYLFPKVLFLFLVMRARTSHPQDLLAILGGYIGAVNIPEKWFPGKLDLVFNSHHIMHVLVVAAVYHMHMVGIILHKSLEKEIGFD